MSLSAQKTEARPAEPSSPTLWQRVSYNVNDTLVMAWRNLIRYTRLPQLLVFSTIQPVMFVLLFAFVFGGASRRPARATSTTSSPASSSRACSSARRRRPSV